MSLIYMVIYIIDLCFLKSRYCKQDDVQIWALFSIADALWISQILKVVLR